MNARVIQGVVFLTVATAIVALVHGYLWARLVRDPAWPAPYGRVGTVALVVLAAALPLSVVALRTLPRPAVAALAWGMYIWMGLMFLLFIGLLATELPRLVALALPGASSPARRLFLSRAAAGLVGVFSLGATAVAVRTALARVRVRRVNVAIPGLSPALAGMTLVQLTDIHVGPTIGRDFIEDMVRQTNALAPDVVVITGDLVDGSVDELAAMVAPLRDLRARHGVFFVTGNHEYYSGVDDWLAHLATLGVRVLRNERVTLGDGAAAIDLAGVDDWSARRFGHGHGADLPRALAGRDTGRPVVLLAHQPKAVAEAADHGVALVLSGHTHGGQLWPWTWLVKLDQPYVAGLHRLRDTWIYVSQGTGYWGPPMRLGTVAEITQVVLHPV